MKQLLAKKPRAGWKTAYFQKVKDVLIEKLKTYSKDVWYIARDFIAD